MQSTARRASVTTRRFFPAALAIAFAWCAPAACGADAWKPSSKVEIVVPAGPGGANDQLGRTIGKILADLKLVDVPVTIVNKPGGGHVYALSYSPRTGVASSARRA